MTKIIPTLNKYSPYLFSMAIGTCLASKRSPIFLGLSPHAVALNTAVAMGLDYFCKNNIKMVGRLALTIFCGIIASKGASRLSKKFDMSTGKSLLAYSLQFGALNRHRFFLNPEELADRLCEAAAHGNLSATKELATHLQFENIDVIDLGEALNLAALNGHAGVIKVLKRCNKFNDIPANGNKGFYAALWLGIYNGHIGVIEALKDCPQFEHIPAHGEYGLAVAFSMAVRKGRVDIIESLKGCPQFEHIPTHGEDGVREAFWMAVRKGHAGIIEALKACPQFEHIPAYGEDGLADALNFAIVENKVDILESLIDCPQFKDIPAVGDNGLGEAFCKAGELGRVEAVRVFANCAKFNGISNGSLQAASRIAGQNGHIETQNLIQGYLSIR